MELVTLINALMANDNALRKQAEQSYEQAKAQNPQQVVAELLQLVRAPDANIRAFAPVLLRRLIEFSTGVYGSLTPDQRQSIKSQLLEAVSTETIPHIRRKLGHCIAELAATCQRGQEEWNELLPCVSTLAASAQPSLRETAFDILAKLGEYASELLTPHRDSFLTLFTNSLNDAEVQVQVACLKAAVSFLVTLENRADLVAFTILIPAMLRTMESMLHTNDEVTLSELISALVSIAEVHPKFFRSHLEPVSNAMLFLIKAKDKLDQDVREVALEFLLTLCENAGGMVRKHPQIIHQLVPATLELMCELEDDDQWVTKFDDPETFVEGSEMDNSISDTAAEGVDRLSNSLGGQAVLPVCIPVIQAYLSDQNDWKRRRAALYATCLLGEGCKQLMSRELDNVMQLVMPFFEDAHPRVQYAAVHCIGQLAEDFGDMGPKKRNFQAKYHQLVLPQLIRVLQNEQSVLRTRALAASVVINFCNPNTCKRRYVSKYSEALLEALFNAIRSCPRQVQEQAMTAVASVARVIEHEFDRFYPIFIPVAKDVLLNAQGKEYALLRGKSMEAIALIGQAVGKERFVNDAKEIMEILIRNQQQSETLESSEIQYLSQSCVRIGNILKEDFVAYLPHVVPPLIRQAQIQPDIVLSDIQEEEEEEEVTEDANGLEVVTVDIRGVGKKRLHINTSALEEKTNACQMLYQCALDLEGAFLPYVEQVAQVLIPLLTFEYVEDIRIVSALTMSKLLIAAIEGTKRSIANGLNASPDFPQRLFQEFFEPLLKALEAEQDLECLEAVSDAVSSALQICKESNDEPDSIVRVTIPIELVPRVVEILKSVAAGSATRRMQQHQENRQDEDYDEEAALQQSDNDELEDGVFHSMVDSIGWLIKSHKEAFFPVFQAHLLPWITPLLNQTTMNSIRGQAICMIDDVIEHCGAAAQELLPLFLNHLVQGLEDPSPAIIQAAAYGVGVCAERSGPGFEPFCVPALQKLLQLITASSNVEDDEVGAARDNAISAVAKICLFRERLVPDVAQVWRSWLSWLPIFTDVLEARDVHERLVSVVEQGHAHVLGKDYANLPQILKTFAALLAYDPFQDEEEPTAAEEEEDMAIVSDKTKARIGQLLGRLQNELPSTVVEAAWRTLSAEEQQAFASLGQ